MGFYDGLFGSRKLFGSRGGHPEHFQVRPFAETMLEDLPERSPPPPHYPPGRLPPREEAPYVHENPVFGEYPPAPTYPPQPARYEGAARAPSPTGYAVAQLVAEQAGRHAANYAAETGSAPEVWNERYDRSLGNIQSHIHAIAGAVAMLDAVEHKMLAIKCELQRIRDANLMIDGEKVLKALQTLSTYVNQAISSVDDQCVNMLRDAKLEIRFAEMAAGGDHSEGVALTMISLERLIDYKIKSALADGLVAEETPEFVNDLCAIISSNIQILTSVMLALFASRDYTQAVTRLAARESIIPAIANGSSRQQLPSATIDRLQLDRIDQRNGSHEQLRAGRASLSELLKGVRESRSEWDAPFN